MNMTQLRNGLGAFLAGLAVQIFPKDQKLGRDYSALVRRWHDDMQRRMLDWKEGRNEKWTVLQALAIYNEEVKPKTYTLYEDALKRAGGTYEQHNLYLMMQFMHGQVIDDLYTVALNIGQIKNFPTKRSYVAYIFSEWIKNFDQQEKNQSVIDSLKGK